MKRSEPLCKIIQYFSCLDLRIVANNALQATDTVSSCLVSLMQNMHKRKYKRKCINKYTCTIFTTTYILMKDAHVSNALQMRLFLIFGGKEFLFNSNGRFKEKRGKQILPVCM